MKKIYTITLEDDIPLSDKITNDLKVICYLLYDDIKDIEQVPGSILYHKNIINNELYDNYDGEYYQYHFLSDEDIHQWQKYEPFMISNNTFGFTVNDNTITDSELNALLEENQKLLGSNYQFHINSYLYEHDTERIKIINRLNHNSNHNKQKVLIRTILSMLKI